MHPPLKPSLVNASFIYVDLLGTLKLARRRLCDSRCFVHLGPPLFTHLVCTLWHCRPRKNASLTTTDRPPNRWESTTKAISNIVILNISFIDTPNKLVTMNTINEIFSSRCSITAVINGVWPLWPLPYKAMNLLERPPPTTTVCRNGVTYRTTTKVVNKEFYILGRSLRMKGIRKWNVKVTIVM